MKKLFAIAFTCVYLLPTVGVIKSTHYCMGRINSSPQSSEVSISSLDNLTSGPDVIILDESGFYRADMEQSNPRNGAEFFIISDLYSEAFLILLA